MSKLAKQYEINGQMVTVNVARSKEKMVDALITTIYVNVAIAVDECVTAESKARRLSLANGNNEAGYMLGLYDVTDYHAIGNAIPYYKNV